MGDNVLENRVQARGPTGVGQARATALLLGYSFKTKVVAQASRLCRSKGK